MLRRDRRFFLRAVITAGTSTERVRVGAVLARGRTLLSEACNVRRNRTGNVPYGNETYHAEVAALKGHEHRFGLTMYIARINQAGIVVESAPCDDCRLSLEGGTAVSHIVYMGPEGLVRERV